MPIPVLQNAFSILRESLYVAEADIEFTILLPQPPSSEITGVHFQTQHARVFLFSIFQFRYKCRLILPLPFMLGPAHGS